jgi:hypothetical protein
MNLPWLNRVFAFLFLWSFLLLASIIFLFQVVIKIIIHGTPPNGNLRNRLFRPGASASSKWDISHVQH